MNQSHSNSHPPKFPIGSRVFHLKTNSTYKILGTCFYEPDATPCYYYFSALTGKVWVRPTAEMEDGRFELLS